MIVGYIELTLFPDGVTGPDVRRVVRTGNFSGAEIGPLTVEAQDTVKRLLLSAMEEVPAHERPCPMTPMGTGSHHWIRTTLYEEPIDVCSLCFNVRRGNADGDAQSPL